MSIAASPALPRARQWSADTWVIALPFTAPMSMNHRKHWRVKAAETKSIREAACVLARSAKVPHMDRARVKLCYRPADSRRRDAINLAPTLKACEDGLVDAGVVDDDTPVFLEPVMPLILPKLPGQVAGQLWLVVDRLA